MAGFNNKKSSSFGQVGLQLSIRDQLDLDPTDHIKVAMHEALRGCSLSREQVVDEMNRLAALCGITTGGRAQKVTVAMLDKWVARSAKDHIIPTRYIKIFSIITGTDLLAQALCRPGTMVASEEDTKCLLWAKAELDARRKRKEAKRLAQEVGAE